MDTWKTIDELLTASGLSDPVPIVVRLRAYLDGVLEANQRLNLTRVTDPDDAVRLHLLDSLTCLQEVIAAPPGRLCDIGTGGGFPGVPLALASGRETVLLDSVAKKCRAVSEVLESLNLDTSIDCVAARAEQYAADFPASCAVVTARAVAPLGALVELATPLLAKGGVFVALKGAPAPDEVASGDKTAALVGMRRKSSRSATLPGGEEIRTIISYERISASKVTLPRRIGLAQKSPLV